MAATHDTALAAIAAARAEMVGMTFTMNDYTADEIAGRWLDYATRVVEAHRDGFAPPIT